ncbi:MAG: hypothetical protein Ct9H90mP3_1760 [Flammeovirgaceae bacterium]|nr:MAG: hypothetical protein Ct9H90mP3_1760 [Flammeovirgaceae bacterium]
MKYFDFKFKLYLSLSTFTKKIKYESNVVGAGNVGATCADVLAQKEVCNEVVLVDIKEGLSGGKSLISFKKPQI